MTLAEWLARVREHDERIFIREEVDGKFESVALASLSPERWGHHVARMLQEGILPVYLKEGYDD